MSASPVGGSVARLQQVQIVGMEPGEVPAALPRPVQGERAQFAISCRFASSFVSCVWTHIMAEGLSHIATCPCLRQLPDKQSCMGGTCQSDENITTSLDVMFHVITDGTCDFIFVGATMILRQV